VQSPPPLSRAGFCPKRPHPTPHPPPPSLSPQSTCSLPACTPPKSPACCGVACAQARGVGREGNAVHARSCPRRLPVQLIRQSPTVSYRYSIRLSTDRSVPNSRQLVLEQSYLILTSSSLQRLRSARPVPVAGMQTRLQARPARETAAEGTPQGRSPLRQRRGTVLVAVPTAAAAAALAAVPSTQRPRGAMPTASRLAHSTTTCVPAGTASPPPGRSSGRARRAAGRPGGARV
jgi:hypothetical protein